MTLDLDALRGHTAQALGQMMCGAVLGSDRATVVVIETELSRRDAAVAELVAAASALEAFVAGRWIRSERPDEVERVWQALAAFRQGAADER